MISPTLLAASIAGMSLLAQAGDVPNAVAPYVGAGSSVAAVGGLVYVARKMSNGELVAVDTAKLQTDNTRTIDGLMRVIDEQREDKRQLRAMVEQHVELQRETNQIIGRFGNIIVEANK